MVKHIARAGMAALGAALTLAGCASDIMNGYIGRDLEAAMARYGPPDGQFDLPDGRRAFQWVEVDASTSPGAVSIQRGDRTRVELAAPTTTFNRCFYTMYARYDGARRQWIFESFEPPAFGC